MATSITADIYEKLGTFYLGQPVDPDTQKPIDNVALYDSSNLTTHAAIIGMTGSGKTGLGIGLIEEAAIDGIPVIAIDPKGDLANLMLAYPEMTAADLKPWIDASAAASIGKTVDEQAIAQSKLWKKGLKDSGQEGRIPRWQAASTTRVYTPGMSSGAPISILGSLAAPSEALRQDSDLYAERIEATASSLLALIDVDCDPLSSREHILMSNLIKHCWDNGENMDLARLISQIQNPPITRVGVLDLETFYPAPDRVKLALRMNGLLASPGFAAWLEGESLKAESLFYGADGKPQTSVLSIAHLSDSQRMFFVTLVLAEVISWMRRQPGTGSLRAIVYIDELFGYMPPNGNPPSKKLLLTLLKQARAFGVGVVLSSQNPVDLDYKGLSNCGTWFLGRLQTKQDREKVLSGLETGEVSRDELSSLLISLGKRQFLMHNVRESAPQVFNSRWVMSYLAGPVSRDQLVRLCELNPASASLSNQAASTTATPKAKPTSIADENTTAPVPESGVKVLYANPTTGAGDVWYSPELYFDVDVAYFSKTHGVDVQVRWKKSVLLDGEVDFDNAIDFEEASFDNSPINGASFDDCPNEALRARSYKAWQKSLVRWLRVENTLELWRNKKYKLVSEIDESEAAFIGRVQHAQREARDIAVGKLRAKYEKKLDTLQNKVLRAEQAVERESEQASASKMNAVISIGSTLIGALFGRKMMSATNVRSAGTALRRTSKIAKEGNDVERAEERLALLKQQVEELDVTLQDEVATLEEQFSDTPEIESIKIRAKSSDIGVNTLALLWNGRG